MPNKELYNYYEIDQYCKWEGLNTEYFIQQIAQKRNHKIKRIFTVILSMLIS